MKLKKPKPKLKPGPKTEIGGKRMNFFSGDALDKLPKLNKLLREAGVRRVVTASFALREGARCWIQEQIAKAKKAVSGELHAKKRKPSIV